MNAIVHQVMKVKIAKIKSAPYMNRAVTELHPALIYIMRTFYTNAIALKVGKEPIVQSILTNVI